MSFLQLPPASRRLRQAAKAHAAGEIARDEYRRMRREIIDELHVEFAANGSTVDAFSLGPDSTQRRSRPPVVFGDTLESRAPTPPSTSQWSRRNALIALSVFVGVLSLFVAGAVLAASKSVIPSLAERDPNPQNSMVLPVKGLRVEAITPAPAISETELTEKVNVWFAEAKAATQNLDSTGFSKTELGEVGNLLNRLGVHDQDGLSASALTALNALVVRQKKRREVTLAQLERIADKVQDYFRGRGYLAARAYVPAQNVQNELAVLHVLPGQLESVVIDSSSGLAQLATSAFEAQLGKAATTESLEQVFYKLNSLAGVKATGSLRAGGAVGATSLDLQLSNPSRVIGGLSVDNHGDKRSARYRLRGQLAWQNPLGRGDNLSLDLAQRYDTQDATGLSIDYRTPTYRLGDVALVSYHLNDFTVDARTGDFAGQSSTFRASWERQLYGQRNRSLTAGIGVALQRLELAAVDQKPWWIEPRIAAHRVFDESRWVLRGNASVAAGRLGGDRFAGQPASFAVLNTEVSAWRPLANQELRIHAKGQLGTDDLPDSLKQTLGGPGRVSAVRPGSFLTDSGFVMGLEMSATPARLKSFGTLAFFTNVGSGQRDRANRGASAFAWEGGVLWRLPTGSSFTGEIRLGVPLSLDGLNGSGDEDARLLLSLGWRPWGR